MLPYHPDWSRTSTSTGYVVVHCPDHPRAWSTGYVYAHVIVMEQSLGRLLEKGEVVHHKDLNRKNYDIGNLELKTKAGHAADHVERAKPVEMTCDFCGKSFKRRNNQRKQNKGYKHTFCSRKCNGSFGRCLAPVA